MRLLPLFACLAFAALPTDDPAAARVGERVLTESDFGRWLVARVGPEFLDQFVGDEVVLAAAQARGLMPTDAELDQACDVEYRSMLDEQYHGDVKRFEEILKLTHADPESWRRHRLHALRVELAQVNLARADRVIGEEDLRRRFAEEYGSDAENIALDVVFFSSYRRASEAQLQQPDFAALREAARQRAEAARERLAAGEPVAAILGDSDPPASPAVHDGVLGHYRPQLLGREVDDAVTSLDDPGDTTPVVLVFDGFYVVRLRERRPVTFEAVRADLERAIHDQPVTSGEHSGVRAACVAAAAPEFLLR